MTGACLAIYSFLTFVAWYRLPRTVPLDNLLWERPVLWVLAMLGLAAAFGFMRERPWARSLLAATLVFKLGFVAMEPALLTAGHLAHLTLTALFLLNVDLRLGLATLSWGSVAQRLAAGWWSGRPALAYDLPAPFLAELSPWLLVAEAVAPLLWLTPWRRAGVGIYLAVQLYFWWIAGLYTEVGPFLFETTGFMLTISALCLVFWEPLRFQRGALVLAVLLLPGLPFFEALDNRPVVARYEFEHGRNRLEVEVELPYARAWGQRPRARCRARNYVEGELVREVEDLRTPVTLGDEVVFDPRRFELVSRRRLRELGGTDAEPGQGGSDEPLD